MGEEYYRQKYLSERRYRRFAEKVAHMALLTLLMVVMMLAFLSGGGMR